MTAKKKASTPDVSTPAPAAPSRARASRKAPADGAATASKAPAPRRRVTKAASVVPASPEAAKLQPVDAEILAAPARPVVTDENIRVRAYFLALEHGGRGGSVDFWLQAEQELLRAGASRD